jgi:hypothetical protein
VEKMKDCIVYYINEIHKSSLLSTKTFEYKTEWIFYGDGQGDFEESSKQATKEVIKKYIDSCREQILFARQILRELKEVKK